MIVNPTLRLRDTPWRKYFRFDAKSDYLVLRKSLPRLQENTLVVELVFPVGSKNASGNKQVLVARLELFIDKNANNFAKKVRPQKTAPRFSSSQLIAKVRERNKRYYDSSTRYEQWVHWEN